MKRKSRDCNWKFPLYVPRLKQNSCALALCPGSGFEFRGPVSPFLPKWDSLLVRSSEFRSSALRLILRHSGQITKLHV
jgi:hypothetical protein